MRVILFSQDRVSVESPGVYLYLLILLVFALIASYHVLTVALLDPDRSLLDFFFFFFFFFIFFFFFFFFL